MFLPFLQNRPYLENPSPAFGYLTLVVRTDGDPATLAPGIRSAIHALDKNIPLSEIQTMDQVVAEATSQSRFYLVLLAGFATVALLLAGVGIYGVMSYSVSRRSHEIGIRMALGAQGRDVLKLVVFQGIIQAMAGIAVGLAGALALSRLMAGLLYGTRATDPMTFVAAVLVLCVVAVAASYIPARRAAKVDPMVALRYE